MAKSPWCRSDLPAVQRAARPVVACLTAALSRKPSLMIRTNLLLASLLLSIAVSAPAKRPHDDADAPAPPEKISALIVYGNDPCPRSTGDEIVVCGREPESERYRIPKRFRGQKKPLASQGAWSNTVQQLEMVSRRGLPNSCSPVGSNGATGCYDQFIAQARAERQYDKDNADKP